MMMKKIAIFSALVVSSLAVAQSYQGGPIPEYSGAGNFGMMPNSMTPPGFQGQQVNQVGEQPSYVQAGAQNCYDRNHRSPIVGAIQPNGQPMPVPGQPGHFQ